MREIEESSQYFGFGIRTYHQLGNWTYCGGRGGWCRGDDWPGRQRGDLWPGGGTDWPRCPCVCWAGHTGRVTVLLRVAAN